MPETAFVASHPSETLRTRRRWPSARWVAVRVVAIAAALELFYLAAANAMLTSKLVEKLANASDDIELTYRTAWSLWPGHVEVRDLALRAKDYNVEFLVQVDAATVNIAITDLFRRRFHATSVDTRGTVYRMRHHVHSVGNDGPRIAAYPSIEGLPDPPLYAGPEQPPLTDADYNLWEIQLEDVRAEMAELWILEYRYRGAGVATGRFHLRPARWFEVGPAALELAGGELTVDGVPVARRATGRIECFAEHTDVENVTGLAVLHGVSAGARLTLDDMDLSFANVYARHDGARISGHGSGRIDVATKNAALSPGGAVAFKARPLDVRWGKLHFGGPADLELRVGPPGAEGKMVAELSSRELVGAVRNKETPSPSVHGLVARAFVEPLDMRRDFEVTEAELSVSRASLPSLAWFDPLLDGDPRLDGAATLEGRVSHDKARGFFADAKGSFERVSLKRADGAFRAESGDFRTALKSAPDDGERLKVSKLDVDLKDVTVETAGTHITPFAATFRAESGTVDSVSPFVARGVVRAHAEPAGALLPLVIEPAFLRTLAKSTLDLKRVDARAAFRTSPAVRRIEVLELRSGKLEAHGLWQNAPPRNAEGAFLVAAGDLNLGVKLQDGETDVKVFAGDGWLENQVSKIDGRPRAR